MNKRDSVKKEAREMGIDGNTVIALVSLTGCVFYRQKEIGTWLQHRVYITAESPMWEQQGVVYHTLLR